MLQNGATIGAESTNDELTGIEYAETVIGFAPKNNTPLVLINNESYASPYNLGLKGNAIIGETPSS